MQLKSCVGKPGRTVVHSIAVALECSDFCKPLLFDYVETLPSMIALYPHEGQNEEGCCGFHNNRGWHKVFWEGPFFTVSHFLNEKDTKNIQFQHAMNSPIEMAFSGNQVHSLVAYKTNKQRPKQPLEVSLENVFFCCSPCEIGVKSAC